MIENDETVSSFLLTVSYEGGCATRRHKDILIFIVWRESIRMISWPSPRNVIRNQGNQTIHSRQFLLVVNRVLREFLLEFFIFVFQLKDLHRIDLMNILNALFQRMRAELATPHFRLASMAEHTYFLAGFRMQEMIIQTTFIKAALAADYAFATAIFMITQFALLYFLAAPRARNNLLRTLRIVRLNFLKVEDFRTKLTCYFLLITGIFVFSKRFFLNLNFTPLARSKNIITFLRNMFFN